MDFIEKSAVPSRDKKPKELDESEDGITSSSSGEEVKSEKKKTPYDIAKRHFLLTTFKVEKFPKIIEYLRKRKQCTYIVACQEFCPKTGKEHYHIYVHFNNTVKLSRKKCCKARLDPCRGTSAQAIDYVFKRGNPRNIEKGIESKTKIVEEYGSPPRGEGGKLSGAELKSMTEAEIIDYDPRCHRAHLEAKSRLLNPVDFKISDWYKPNMKVYWIQGPTEAGKSLKARNMIRDEMGDPIVNAISYVNGFWLRVGTAVHAIYDDFRDSIMKPHEFINFIDYNKHPMNVKGGERVNNYTTIIITSVQRIEDIYFSFSRKNKEPRQQWMRRLIVIDMYDDTEDTLVSDSEEEIKYKKK